MSAPLQIDVVTIFPGMLDGFTGESMIRRAIKADAVSIRTVNPRDFTTDVHRTVDDRPYGGGPGMVMKPEPLAAAIESVHTPDARVILMSPQGRRFLQEDARALLQQSHLILVAGHYEGIDERLRQTLVDDELSIGDFVLTNGVLPAAVVIDAVVRLLPGVLGGGPEAFGIAMRSHGLVGSDPQARHLLIDVVPCICVLGILQNLDHLWITLEFIEAQCMAEEALGKNRVVLLVVPGREVEDEATERTGEPSFAL